MTTNKEWLFSLPLEELFAWFESEHVETPNATLHGDTAALEAKIAELTAERNELKGQVFTLKVECDDLTSACDDLENELHKAKAERERYREKFGKCIDYADAIHDLMDEGLA